MSVPLRPEARLKRIRTLTTLELLDRVTVLRDQMDDEAIELLHAELAGRGIGPEEIGAHLRDMRLKTIPHHKDGKPATCQKCARAAVMSRLQWHMFWSLVPLFREHRYWCEEHARAPELPPTAPHDNQADT